MPVVGCGGIVDVSYLSRAERCISIAQKAREMGSGAFVPCGRPRTVGIVRLVTLFWGHRLLF